MVLFQSCLFRPPTPSPSPPPPDTAATFKIKDGWSTNTYDNKETIFQRDHLFDKGTHTIVMEPKRVEVLGIRLPDKGVGFEGTLAGPDGYNIEVSIECPADTVQYKASSNYLPSDASTFKLVKDVEVSRPVVRSCSNTTSTSLTCHAASTQLGHSTPAINITNSRFNSMLRPKLN